MRGGKTILVSTAMLMVGACMGNQAKLEIRSTPTKLARGHQPIPHRIAEARGQLALGNVGLALEAFRMAAREDPNSTDALVGIATCYDQMGRFDLSRRSYEAALAIAPADTNVLGAFAASLQAQGRTAEALSVRQEIAVRDAAAAALASASEEAPKQVAEAPATPAPARPEPRQSSAPLAPVQVAAAPEPALPMRTWSPPPVHLAEPVPGKVNVAAPAVEHARLEMAAKTPAPVAMAEAPVVPAETATVGRSVTVKLPPSQPAVVQTVALTAFEAPVPATLAPVAQSAPKASSISLAAFEASVPVTLAPVAPVARVAPAAIASEAPVTPMPALPPLKERTFGAAPQPAFVEERGPRLERVSMGEIALITVSRPVWQAKTVAKTDHSTRLRFVPLREASMTVPVRVRLLNAARVDRLAARTRGWLTDRGWRGIAIGDADSMRSRSVVLYPADKRWLAQRLAGQFGFALAPRSTSGQITVLLGSDAARHPALRRKQA